MTRRVRRYVLLATALLFLVMTALMIVAIVGVLGDEAQESAWRFWAAAKNWEVWVDTSLKLVSLLATLFLGSLNAISHAYENGLLWLAWAWSELKPHLQWIGPLFGIAMGAWRWWDKRESSHLEASDEAFGRSRQVCARLLQA